MQTAGPSGFYNVPTTKLLILFVGTCSVLASILDLKPIFHLQLSPHVTLHHQFWRLLTSHCAFTNSGELFFGLLIIYSMRIIERQYGSAKYAAFLFITLWVSTFLELGALVSGAKLGFRRIPGGPYALVFSMLYQYHRIIPATYRFRIFGATLNDKMFLYAPALQMMISQSFATIVPCICGMMAGALYRSDVGNVKKWRFPRYVRNAASRVSDASLASGPIPRSSTTMPTTARSSEILTTAANLRNRRSNAGTNNARARATNTADVREYIDTLTGRGASAEVQPPPEEDVQILMSMFPDHPRETIMRAFSAGHNNMNRAVEIMLSTPAPVGSSSNDGAGTTSGSNNRP
ncbi:hypothetical protein BDB00DRAFT_391450 [Zychaea mexicana]|uniref:uncharacterized protein n=1 Tax=Zychaea mexicana TaxID=64656 RepID=UPI0022FEA648|nr:uncharacterized protein BDB00DRAFT_391450 [Zychaea mexicana]KAI9498577.1 hypothetical protein BDB00DRAFT_391450 [Zychaea mexicana]